MNYDLYGLWTTNDANERDKDSGGFWNSIKDSWNKTYDYLRSTAHDIANSSTWNRATRTYDGVLNSVHPIDTLNKLGTSAWQGNFGRKEGSHDRLGDYCETLGEVGGLSVQAYLAAYTGARAIAISGYRNIASYFTRQYIKGVVNKDCKDIIEEVVILERSLDKTSRNRFKPDINATGNHTVFRRDLTKNNISHYETYRIQTNIRNPSKWETVKRYDGQGKAHINKLLQEKIETPHVHEPSIPGGIRRPQTWEIPR